MELAHNGISHKDKPVMRLADNLSCLSSSSFQNKESKSGKWKVLGEERRRRVVLWHPWVCGRMGLSSRGRFVECDSLSIVAS